MARLGADVDQLDTLASHFENGATTLDGHAATIDAQLRTLWWRGSVADQFTAAWTSADRRRITTTATGLREIAKRVREDAAQQRAASGDVAALGPSIGLGIGNAMAGFLRDLPWAGAGQPDPQEVQKWWSSLSRDERDRLIEEYPDLIGNTDGIDPDDRFRANQINIGSYVSDMRTEIEDLRAALERGDLADLDIPGLELLPNPLGDAREAAIKGRIAHLEEQIARYEELGSDGHQILFFSTENGGRIAEVHGDLNTADTLAIVVPGISNDLNNFPISDSNGARLASHTDAETAVIEWLGYDTPGGFDPGALSTNMAETGGRELYDFVENLQAVSDAEVAISAHSYGTIVTTEAAKLGMEVETVVLLGSPGVPAQHVSVFGGADVYAAENSTDYLVADLGEVPHGTDPTNREFGANLIETDGSGHSSYYDPGSKSLWGISDAINHVEARWVTDDGLDVQVRREPDGSVVETYTGRIP